MADTIVKYIINETKRNAASILRFIMPSYPPGLLFKIGTDLEEELIRLTDIKVQFKYGIAYRLGQKWAQGEERERSLFQAICDRGWYNESDNLTSLRHLVKMPGYDCLVVLLAGYEDIYDQASLQDFFHLDQRSLWEICLKGKFTDWVQQALQKYVNPDGNEDTLEKIASTFSDIYQYGLTDPLGVSTFLEGVDFSTVLDAGDAYKLILSNLKPFGLPNMVGLTKLRKRSISDYIEEAQKFVNYSRFLELDQRNKVKAKIEEYRNHIREIQEEIEKERLGCFKDLDELLNFINDYIESGSNSICEKLLTADFVFINDKILKFKSKGSKAPPSQRIIKLKGLSLEVFLKAIWVTIAQFKKMQGSSLFSWDKLTKISLRSVEFKHQYGSDDNELAQSFLLKLLGGVDDYIEEQLCDENTGEVRIQSFLSPEKEDAIKYIASRSAEPSLRFEVKVLSESGGSHQQMFSWPLGKNHQSRFLVNLYDWVLKQYKHNKGVLPVFSLPYLNEIFMAKDGEDAVRILNIALESQMCSMEDLFAVPEIDSKEPLKNQIYALTHCYQDFLQEYSKSGFFAALNRKYTPLRKSYQKLYEDFLAISNDTALAPFLMKAFLIIPDFYVKENNWQWDDSLPCAIITPLHPALLDMLYHQHTYLCRSFLAYCRRGLEKVGTKGLAEKNWNRLIDLARIKWPLMGILSEDNTKLDTNVQSFDYIHLVGSQPLGYSSLSSRLLVAYDEDGEEDEITDAEMFQETQASRLIKQVLLDYCRLHPYANDGLCIGVYCGGTIQQIIEGLDSFLEEITKQRNEDVYSLKLIFFSDSPDDTGILKWVNAWKKRWEQTEDIAGKEHYAKSLISVYYHVVPPRDWVQLQKLIQETDLDLMFFNNFTQPQKSEFVPLINVRECRIEDYLKYPVLEKVSCSVTEGGWRNERELVLSNLRFKLSSLHTEVMVRLKRRYDQLGKNVRHIVVRTNEFQPWEKVIDVAHGNSVWVVCIDPIVDEKLLRKKDNKREIIGFGTGVGSHGENNFTISTEQFQLSDIVRRISNQLTNLLGDMDCSELARSIIREASSISGLSVVKATGPSEYVRDFIAYSLVRKLLPKEEGAFCDELISLDAFQHWFDFGPGEMRPDLLRLQARIENGYFNIKAQIIECKFAQESEGYIEKALQQVEEGLKRLVPKFLPRMTSAPLGITSKGMKDEDYPPDQRYWWMQLHRLITSRGEVRKANYTETLEALEWLGEGCYNIEWGATVVAFWTNSPGEDIDVSPHWNFTNNGMDMDIYLVQGGKEFIKKAGLGKIELPLFAGHSLCYKHQCNESSSSVEDYTILAPAKESIIFEQEEKNEDKLPEKQGKDARVGSKEMDILSGNSSPPKRILLGSGTAGGRDVYWEFGHPDLPNRHLLIFGASGTGKTYTIQALMTELSKSGINSLIVDYTNGFTNKQLEHITREKLNPRQHVVRIEPLAINPFRKQHSFIDDIPLEDKPPQVAQRVSGVFAEVYNLGEQQKAVLYNAIQEGVTEEGNNFNLYKLLQKLETFRDRGGAAAHPTTTVINKIKPFVDMNPFGKEDTEGWEKLFNDPDSRCHIIQLAGFMKDSARLITEFTLMDLYWYYRAKGSKDVPRVIVLDEIQNLDHRLESPLGQFLTEGRKFGISLILATQTLSNLEKEERDRLFQASHKLFFKPADTEIKYFAQLIADATNDRQENWIGRLSALKRGECYSLGYAFNEGNGILEVNRWFKIKIKSLEDRL